jgi:hypothetical protein
VEDPASHDPDGAIVGNLAVLDTKPLDLPPHIESIFRRGNVRIDSRDTALGKNRSSGCEPGG